MFKSFNTKLAGVTFGDCQEAINKWGYRTSVTLTWYESPTIITIQMPSVSGSSLIGWAICNGR
ncbi:hypothetical protein JCM12296A_24940 [Desulfosarcina cetonica]